MKIPIFTSAAAPEPVAREIVTAMIFICRLTSFYMQTIHINVCMKRFSGERLGMSRTIRPDANEKCKMHDQKTTFGLTEISIWSKHIKDWSVQTVHFLE